MSNKINSESVLIYPPTDFSEKLRNNKMATQCCAFSSTMWILLSIEITQPLGSIYSHIIGLIIIINAPKIFKAFTIYEEM